MTVTGDLQTAVRKVRLRNSSMEGHAMCVSGEKRREEGHIADGAKILQVPLRRRLREKDSTDDDVTLFFEQDARDQQ